MDIKVVKKLIRKHLTHHNEFVSLCMRAERYYKKRNDILYENVNDYEENPLRTADNRIPSNFYSLLVNQKASYMFTAPPLFDIGNDSANDKIKEILGDNYSKYCKDLCINASNDGVAWLHLWKNKDNKLLYAPVSAIQIVPVWTNNLNKELAAVFRCYDDIDDNGTKYDIYEYWTKDCCYCYRNRCDLDLFEGLEPYKIFQIHNYDSGLIEKTEIKKHGFEDVPFIPFFNNNIMTSDLDSIKELIDVYDKVFSGFINDLEDIQEIIFVLSGYEGENLGEFLSQLKKYKTIKLDGDKENNSSLQTLSIDIPIEAREKMLSITRKAIFEQGQGVDPEPQNFGNASGVALKYFYSLLELKSGLMETEFKLGFGKLIRFICSYLNIECKSIIQTWTRTSITNDIELADIATKSIGIISNKTILKNHPWVEDVETEEKEIETQKNKEQALWEGQQEGDISVKEE